MDLLEGNTLRMDSTGEKVRKGVSTIWSCRYGLDHCEKEYTCFANCCINGTNYMGTIASKFLHYAFGII